MLLNHDLLMAFGRDAANHIWQSTAFAAVACLVSFALKANHANVRYWLWFAASLKFLVPFSLFFAVGSRMGTLLVPALPISAVPPAIDQIAQPFTSSVQAFPPEATARAAGISLPVVLWGIWFIGFLAVLLHSSKRWREVRAAVRASVPLRNGREADSLRRVLSRGNSAPRLFLVSSKARLEPGIFGILRPVLWLPAGIANYLSDAELDAVLAHETCHARRRDNLAGSMHMAVQALFWFHPLVWWLGARIVEERERACDEDVVQLGDEPRIYAESILKVCEFFLASPVCAAGVTGGRLKKRIEGIMANHITRKLSFAKAALLVAAATLSIAGPVVIGLSRRAHGQIQSSGGVILGMVDPGPSQTQQADLAAPAFESVSIAPTGSMADHQTPREYGGIAKIWWPVEYKGDHLSGDRPLGEYIEFAFGGVKVSLDHEQPGPKLPALRSFYHIDAAAPSGTPIETIRPMLRRLLAERFGFRYHLTDRERRVYYLIRGAGAPQLVPATASHSTPHLESTWLFQFESVPVASFAGFLSSLAFGDVIDRTGIQGNYAFDIDLRKELGGPNHRTRGPDLAVAEAQRVGLKLEPGTEVRRFLVVDGLAAPDKVR